MVIGGAVSAGEPWIAFTFIIGAILTVIYLLRVFTTVFLGAPKIENVKEGSISMLWSVGMLAVFSIAGGLLINYPANVVQAIVQQMAVVVR
jgi:NADH-quinone oxidoreductase subunit L